MQEDAERDAGDTTGLVCQSARAWVGVEENCDAVFEPAKSSKGSQIVQTTGGAGRAVSSRQWCRGNAARIAGVVVKYVPGLADVCVVVR